MDVIYKKRPVARTNVMAVREASGGVVICDESGEPVLRLNRPAAVVWRHCDGAHTIARLAAALTKELGRGDEEQVMIALDDLARHGLIESGYQPRNAQASRISRRQFIRASGAVAVAAVALPMVNSLVLPTPAAAAGPIYGYYGQPQQPVVTSVTPALGPVAGGNTVTIQGQNFFPTSTVFFGSVMAAGVTFVSSTELTVVAPPGVEPGTVDVTVTTPGGTSVTSSADEYTYFAYTEGGSFVIGDLSVGAPSSGTPVLFWGAKWAKANSLSGGAAPSSFKGFADSTATPAQGASWYTDPGNSAPPPSSVPLYTAMIVAGRITKSGSVISGNTVHVVVVKVDPGYQGDPGHAGTGTIFSVIS
jgi:hypothetical protein